MGINFLKVFEGLLPKSRFWSLIHDRSLRQFFDALGVLPETIKAHADSVWLEAFPEHTTFFRDWSVQFGSPETLDAEGIAAEWAAFGSSTPQYLQDILHAAGFGNLYVHEWWVPGSDPVEYRNPFSGDNPLIHRVRVLVNDVVWIDKGWKWQSGGHSSEQSRADATIRFGDFDGWVLRSKVYACRDNPDEYPHYFYVCGPVWPEYALVAKSKLRQLMRLIYKIKELHLRCLLCVQVYDDGGGETDFDIQDTWWHDDQYQDTIDQDDQIQEIV